MVLSRNTEEILSEIVALEVLFDLALRAASRTA
jgi:hypothetical protein